MITSAFMLIYSIPLSTTLQGHTVPQMLAAIQQGKENEK